MEEEAGIKPQVSASRTSALTITSWLPLAKSKREAFLSRNLDLH